jgi:hypothetical protein
MFAFGSKQILTLLMEQSLAFTHKIQNVNQYGKLSTPVQFQEFQILQPLGRAFSYLSSGDIYFRSMPKYKKTKFDSDMHFSDALTFNAISLKCLLE